MHRESDTERVGGDRGGGKGWERGGDAGGEDAEGEDAKARRGRCLKTLVFNRASTAMYPAFLSVISNSNLQSTPFLTNML